MLVETREEQLIEDGVPIMHAANIAGISVETLCSYRRKHRDFDEANGQAISRGIRARAG